MGAVEGVPHPRFSSLLRVCHAIRMRIVALGGGGFWLGESPALDDYLLSVVGVPRPKVCFVGTASGDSEAYVRRFYAEFGKRDCRPSHFPLFAAPPAPAREHLLAQDL